jgi:prepilin-type N-terminal cleavage/methylation domain-containing protein
MTTRTRQSARAFTLLEMILAMAMVAVLSGSLYMSLTVAFKARDSAQAAISPVRTATIAMDLIRQDFESVTPPAATTDPTADPALATLAAPNTFRGPFQGIQQAGAAGGGGVASSIVFFTLGRETASLTGQDRPLLEGPRRIELMVHSEAGQSLLVRRLTRNILALTTPPPEDEVLCRGVRSFLIRYYDGQTWTEQWDSTQVGDALPFAVEVTLEIDKNESTPTASPWFNNPQSQTYRITKVFPLACAKPIDETQAAGGVLP